MFLDGVRYLLRHAFLDLQATCEHVNETREL